MSKGSDRARDPGRKPGKEVVREKTRGGVSEKGGSEGARELSSKEGRVREGRKQGE